MEYISKKVAAYGQFVHVSINLTYTGVMLVVTIVSLLMKVLMNTLSNVFLTTNLKMCPGPLVQMVGKKKLKFQK